MASVTTNAKQAPRLVTPLPGPKAAAWVARDEAVMSPSYTRPYPLVVAKARGCTIEDVDGNLFLDFTAGIAVTSTGHCHPQVVSAIKEQADKLLHMSGTDFYYAPEIELAERLARLAPGDSPKRVFFTNSGAETIEAALKLARQHTARKRIVSFYGAFHGRTYGALSISGSKSLHQRGFGPMLPGVQRLPFDCERSDFEQIFATCCPAEEVAAVFVEPIQGEGGFRVPREGFLPMLREICDEHGILLVADEIQTGIGRTGKMFAVEHTGVVPDMICLAKGIASGLPLGALVTRAEVMDWPPGTHASTFGGNPVCCASALATLELVEKEYAANAACRGARLRAGLESLCADVDWMAHARGRGLMQAVDIVDANGRGDHQRRDELVQAAFERGLLLLGCGHAGLRFIPSLCVADDEIDTALDIVRAAASAL